MTEEIADLPAVRTGGPGPIRNALRPPAETPAETISADYTLRPSELAEVLALLVEARQPTMVCNGDSRVMESGCAPAPWTAG